MWPSEKRRKNDLRMLKNITKNLIQDHDFRSLSGPGSTKKIKDHLQGDNCTLRLCFVDMALQEFRTCQVGNQIIQFGFQFQNK